MSFEKYENTPVKGLAEDRFFAWVKTQNFPKGTPITFKPRDDDRTTAEIVQIGDKDNPITLSASQQLSLETEFPELVGKRV